MELITDKHKLHHKTPGGIPSDAGLEYRKEMRKNQVSQITLKGIVLVVKQEEKALVL